MLLSVVAGLQPAHPPDPLRLRQHHPQRQALRQVRGAGWVHTGAWVYFTKQPAAKAIESFLISKIKERYYTNKEEEKLKSNEYYHKNREQRKEYNKEYWKIIEKNITINIIKL